MVGDFGIGRGWELTVSDRIHEWAVEKEADALVTTGDNVYPKRSIDEAWTEPYGWVEEEGLETIASLGNHDVEDHGEGKIMDALGMPGPFYSRTIGDAEVFVLDANRPENKAQLEWLEQALKASPLAWKIVVFHQAAYSCSDHGATPEVIESWVPLFEQTGVDLVLNGHDHNYQRFEFDGVTYVVTGGGGAPLYPVEECVTGIPEPEVSEDSTHHYVQVEGSEDRLVVRAIGVDGSLIDRFEVQPD